MTRHNTLLSSRRLSNITMSQVPRRPHGCWTCRMRHKKCDESVPICQECSSRHIPCHGYNPIPPQWMHDHETYQAELHNIKRIVKENFRLAKITQNRCSSTAQHALPGPMSRRHQSSSPLKSWNGNKTPSILDPYMSIQASNSFIYYLDYIFPLQYPYYVDQPDLGGRGWLFWLLTKSAPLRDAALTLPPCRESNADRY